MKKSNIICIALGLILLSSANCTGKESAHEQKQEKPRMVVTCDPELDDLNSLIRFLLYSTDF
ncbi:MAG: hypothetical protein LBS88_05815, partial [Tannerellaceae bacterium]|nr:hypothetical protein [Tannerellaceae bacterium]